MNSNKSKNGIDFSLNPTLEFLGRSGVREFNNLRIAFISGIDSDILGDSVFYNKQNKFVSNYFTNYDVETLLRDYNKLVDQTGIAGVDIFISSQWPLNIDEEFASK